MVRKECVLKRDAMSSYGVCWQFGVNTAQAPVKQTSEAKPNPRFLRP